MKSSGTLILIAIICALAITVHFGDQGAISISDVFTLIKNDKDLAGSIIKWYCIFIGSIVGLCGIYLFFDNNQK